MKHIGIASALTLGVLLALPDAQAQTYSKTETITYHDNTTMWVLGQTASVSCTVSVPASTACDGDMVSASTFDTTYALPLTTSTFGKLQQTLTYDTTSAVSTGQRGTLKTVSDGRDGTLNTTITFSSWKRGIPQLIQYPATPESSSGSSQSAVVNDNGWLTSVTDENAYTTKYEFDPMGRLSKIDYPDADTVNWIDTIRTFAPVASTEYGIAAGHWKQTVSTGNGRQVTYYDAMWRPLVSERYDTANTSGTLSQTVTRYDADGHAIYQSYPMQGLTGYTVPTQGIRTTYDALDRVTRVEQDSELGVLATTTEYLTGFQTRITNPRGKITTTTAYLTYDQPSNDLPLAITHPEGAYTHISRDVFGKPTRLRRSNSSSPTGGTTVLNRDYTYNSSQELCRTTEPETDATLMGYDAAGNLAWSASGLPIATACDAEGDTTAILARKAARTYDARNRLTRLEFPDDNGTQVLIYTPDGLPAQLQTYEASGLQVANVYSYNKRRLLVGENLSQPGWYTWSLGYTYNTNGHLATVVHPGNETINYAPNALGQATQATSTYGSYATGVSYFPNGAIKQFTYGNGIVHTLTQNTRQLPERSKDVYSTSTAVLDDSYDFDANGNVAAISDGRPNASGNRTMTYDGLDRLTSTASPMFGGTISYTYDVLDNLQTLVAPQHLLTPARNLRYCYDATSQRLSFVRSNSTNCTDGSATTTLEYDPQGNLKLKNAQPYTFDFGNRLRAAPGLESYRYDGHGRRVLAWANASAQNILSMYGQDGVLRYQRDDRKVKVYNYIYLGGSLVATRETPTGTSNHVLKYQHTDALGSPVAVTDASRAVIETSEYEPYGKLLNRPIHDGPGYTGHVEDATTGLTYMQQRYYDPQIGRFLSVDPVTANGNTGGNFNRYWYANNNPYRFTDPDGRAPQDSWYEFTDKRFQDWVHGEKQLEGRGGAQNYSRSDLRELHKEWKELGEPRGKGGKSSSGGSMRGQRGFLTPGLALKANLILYLITYSGELNASEMGAYDRWLKMQEDKKNDPNTKPEPPETDPEPEKEPPPPPPPEEKKPEKVQDGNQ
ncbi:RHS repeat-associated core domain-containing protein [Lysobacter sp. CFH 32150]|uniref:RHS repeat-associated core domain-containing protein n=1 Tax=Lysobacter sp. CFH 32150 TaxID=2927128 RepID=UPI001FA76FC2|nr:RHS repeat-associated core domain-containing protein [Lysobacter sp. CFH 32150]MCI4569370.1 RHS repeat-associated core domain-containing protein [Lysobacter sp. CFH 32150]